MVKLAKIRPKISFFVIYFKFGSLVHHSLEHCLTASRGKIHGKISGGPKLGPKLFLPFSQVASLYFLDIAQDCSLGQRLASSRAETFKKKFCGRNWGPNDLFYCNVVKRPLDLILLGVSHVFKGSCLFFLLYISSECLFYKKIIFLRNSSNDKIC